MKCTERHLINRMHRTAVTHAVDTFCLFRDIISTRCRRLRWLIGGSVYAWQALSSVSGMFTPRCPHRQCARLLCSERCQSFHRMPSVCQQRLQSVFCICRNWTYGRLTSGVDCAEVESRWLKAQRYLSLEGTWPIVHKQTVADWSKFRHDFPHQTRDVRTRTRPRTRTRTQTRLNEVVNWVNELMN